MQKADVLTKLINELAKDYNKLDDIQQENLTHCITVFFEAIGNTIKSRTDALDEKQYGDKYNVKIDGDTVIVSLKESYTQNDMKLEYSKNRCRIGDKFVVKEQNIIKKNECVKFQIKHIKQAKTVMTIKGKCKMKYGEIRDYYLSQK